MEEWLSNLQKALQAGPLPGEAAQNRMASAMRQGKMPRFKPNARTRQSAVMVLLHPTAEGLGFPLIKRPDYPGVHGGQVALPGGRKEAGDADLIRTALRETEEEIGVPAREVEVLGQLSELFVAASNSQVLPVVGRLWFAPRWVPEPREVAYVIPARLAHIGPTAEVRQTNIEAAEGIELQAPYFAIEEHVVWGATAMILSEFRELTRGF